MELLRFPIDDDYYFAVWIAGENYVAGTWHAEGGTKGQDGCGADTESFPLLDRDASAKLARIITEHGLLSIQARLARAVKAVNLPAVKELIDQIDTEWKEEIARGE